MKVYLLLTCLFHSSLSSHDIQASPPRSELVQTTNTTESPNRTITSHVSCTNPIDSVIKPITKASPNRSLHHSDLGWSVCLPTTLCCLLVYHYMFRAGRVDVDVRLEQVRRGRMVSAGRSIFALCIWVPFGGSGKRFLREKWPVEGSHFPTQQGTCPKSDVFLRKSSPHGVYPAHFPARQGENVRRPISSAHFTLDVNGYPVVSPNDQGAPCCDVYPK